MDSKTKHRLLIFLVIIGLAVILLPLFQGGNNLSATKSLVKAPPFPDDSVKAIASVPQPAVISVDPNQVAMTDKTSDTTSESGDAKTDSGQSGQSDTTNSVLDDNPNDTLDLDFGGIEDDIINDNNNVLPPSSNEPAAEAPKQKESETDSSIKSEVTAKEVNAVVPEQKPEAPTVANQITDATKEVAKVVTADASSDANKPKIKKQVAGVVKKLAQGKQGLVVKEPSRNERDLINASQTAWAVQVGTFKNKDNAFRLLNQLRAKGYKAFVQRMSNSSSFASRVYVGPEGDKSDANNLASRLSEDFALDVMVVSYKPLA